MYQDIGWWLCKKFVGRCVSAGVKPAGVLVEGGAKPLDISGGGV